MESSDEPLAGLPVPKHLQGVSLKPLLANPQVAWARPAVSTMKAGNHAVRTDRWRYIRYAGGGEELYDHDADPHEWTKRTHGTQTGVANYFSAITKAG